MINYNIFSRLFSLFIPQAIVFNFLEEGITNVGVFQKTDLIENQTNKFEHKYRNLWGLRIVHLYLHKEGYILNPNLRIQPTELLDDVADIVSILIPLGIEHKIFYFETIEQRDAEQLSEMWNILCYVKEEKKFYFKNLNGWHDEIITDSYIAKGIYEDILEPNGYYLCGENIDPFTFVYAKEHEGLSKIYTCKSSEIEHINKCIGIAVNTEQKLEGDNTKILLNSSILTIEGISVNESSLDLYLDKNGLPAKYEDIVDDEDTLFIQKVAKCLGKQSNSYQIKIQINIEKSLII
jgi:hypothetical protein